MSKSKRKTRNQKIKYQQERELKIKELKKLKQQTIELEKKIKLEEKVVRKAKTVRNLKLFMSVCEFSVPFVVVSALAVGGLNVLGLGLPFRKDSYKKEKLYSLEYQTDGYIEIDEHYKNNNWLNKSLPENELKIYSPWLKDKYGSYKRTVKSYSISSLNDTKIFDAILNEDIDYINENYSEYSEYEEETNEVSFQYEKNIIKANLNFFDEKDTIKLCESDSRNKIVTGIEIAITIVGGIIFAAKTRFSIVDSVMFITSEYKQKIIPLNKLKEELEQKQQKILSLTQGGTQC